ncbi:hypothetical protein PINS_up013937 [Pythium insidiosum]|nr:hypothetical protein PINS_up013937 [Pythium insidiosum]
MLNATGGASSSSRSMTRLQRQTSVMHEIQESQERESLETRYTRLMLELSALCEDRNNLLTTESIEFLATRGRAEPVKLEREPDKVLDAIPKSTLGSKHQELLSADAARRQRVDELTRFFMEAKSDIEFALGGSRDFRESREKDKDGESEREDEKEADTGDEDEDTSERTDNSMDPERQAAQLHVRLLKENIDERVYNPMLIKIRDTDAALYGAILCHPLITGVDPKKDKRRKKKRKDKDRKEKISTSPAVNAMLSPDFTAPPLTEEDQRINISRFVARAIADESAQALLLAAKLVLSWTLGEESLDFSLPLASHIRVLQGERAPHIPKRVSEGAISKQGDAHFSLTGDRSEINVNESTESHESEVQTLPMETDVEGNSSARLSLNTGNFGETSTQDEDIGDEGGVEAGNMEEEGVDEDALMARAIALSLSPEINLREQSTPSGITTDAAPTIASRQSEFANEITPPDRFSPEEMVQLGPFMIAEDGINVPASGVIVALFAHVVKASTDYVDSCRSGILPSRIPFLPHPLTFLLINSLLKDILSRYPDAIDAIPEDQARWKLLASCSLTSLLQLLEVLLFHVEVTNTSPASVGLGQFTGLINKEGSGDTGNRLVESLKNLLERCIEISCDVDDNVQANGQVVLNRSWAVEDAERFANQYHPHIREFALTAWARGISHFFPSQSAKYSVLVALLERCTKIKGNHRDSWVFGQLDMLCARLALPDLAQGFVPASGNIILRGGDGKEAKGDSSSDNQVVDDDALLDLNRKPRKMKLKWSPLVIKSSLTAGSVTPRSLLDFLIENSPPDSLEEVGLTPTIISDPRVIEVLSNGYEQLWNISRKEERDAIECINRLPVVLQMLRDSVTQSDWPRFSFVDDFVRKHPPFVPILDNRTTTEVCTLNGRVLLLRTIQDLMVMRIGGSRGDEPPSLEFDSARCADTMTLLDGNKTARQYTAKQWGMVMATTGCPPNSGVHEWAVRLDRCEKGHIFLGVCTRDASVATYVGGDRQGWGLIGTRALWHNRSKVRGDYGDGFSTGSIVRVRLNTDSGALSFGIEDTDWGIAFDGLTQYGTLYPAIGLYQRDDQVTLIPVRSSSDASKDSAGSNLGPDDVSVPAILRPFLSHSAAVMLFACKFLRSSVVLGALSDVNDTDSVGSVEVAISQQPMIQSVLVPLLSGLALVKSFHGLSSVLALHYIPWCSEVIRLLDGINHILKSTRQLPSEMALDVTGEWELRSMAAGNIPAQQYHLVLTQDKDGNVSGRSSGSFTTVTLTGTIVGTKVRFLETWRQGGTCLVEGRLRTDGTAFSGCYEDAKSHTSGNIVGHKVTDSGTSGGLGLKATDSNITILEVVCASVLGRFSRGLIDSQSPDLVVESMPPSVMAEDEILADSNVEDDGTFKLTVECSSDEYEGWVNSLLLSGGLPSPIIQTHLRDLMKRQVEIAALPTDGELRDLGQVSAEWLKFVTPRFMDLVDDGSPTSVDTDFLQDLIAAQGGASLIDQWVSRHVGESPFMRLGGEPMKVAKRTVCAAMIWHSGFLPSMKRILETSGGNLVESEVRPHENLMHIWRAAQRVIEWAIRAKNSMGSTYAVVAALIIRKAQFLLTIEPSAKAVAASTAVSVMSQDTLSPGLLSRNAVYECAERIYSEVLMQVSRFLEAPIRIANLQSRMLAHSTRAFLRIVGMQAIRLVITDHSTSTGKHEGIHSSFALSTLLEWLSPAAVERTSILRSSKEVVEVTESGTLSTGATTSAHFLNGLGGCGKHLKSDLRDTFEALYGFLCAALSKASWAHDTDLQLVLLEAWGISIIPDDHAFLSRVGVFRVLQTVLDEARATESSNESARDGTELQTRLLESRRKVVQATLKVVHLLAAQVAHVGEMPDKLVVSAEAAASSGLSLGAIPLLRKPSGPETLGKSVFHMLYTELRNALEEFREGKLASSITDSCRTVAIEPTEADSGATSDSSSSGNEAEEYCYQICSLLYSVSGSLVCRSHLSSSRWLRLLLVLLEVGSPKSQRRALKLLRRLLPEVDPTSIRLRADVMDAFDVDSDDDLDAEDSENQASALIRFFMDIVGSICPPSVGEAMLRRVHISDKADSTTPKMVDSSSESLAPEVVVLLRSLYESPKWAAHLSSAIISALSAIPEDCVIESSCGRNGGDNDVEMEEPSVLPELQDWLVQSRAYREALSAFCVLDGHIEGLRIGANVRLVPRTASAQEGSFRGARGVVVAYEAEKSSAEVLIRGARTEGNQQSVTSSSIASPRPIRVPVDDLIPVPEVELDASCFSDDVLRCLLVDKFGFFVNEIKKSLTDLKSTHALKEADDEDDVDDDDDMSNDGSSPSGMDSEMTNGGGMESDPELDAASPREPMHESTGEETADVMDELEKEAKLHKMLLCQHGLRAAALLLRDENAASIFISGSGSRGLADLLQIAISETPTAGLSEVSSLEESWLYLWSRWFQLRRSRAAPAPVKSSRGINITSDDPEVINPMVQQMMEMGFPKEWCEIALARCSQNVEAAINFCFEHSNDMERMVAQYKQSKQEGESSKTRKTETELVNPLLEQLAEMGFPINWCKKALIANRNNVDAALTWILSNGEALEAEDRREEEATQRVAHDSDVVVAENESSIPKPNPLRAVSGQASIGESDMMVEGLVGGGFASVGAPDCVVSRGRWYYEATLLTNGCIQIGWADVAFCGAADRGDGVGDGVHSWAYDGWRQQKWHGQSSPWGAKWKQGDVVGCFIDADAGTILFSLNGKMRSLNMGIAFRGIKFAHGVYPCASFNRRERLQFNLGGSPFKHPPPAGFRPILEVLCREGELITDLPTGFKVIGRREDCLEEAVGEENYPFEARFFGKDAHASMVRTSGSHSRGTIVSGTSRAEMFAELKAIPDDRLFVELLLLTRSLAVLHARRALLALLAKWPSAIVGAFSISRVFPEDAAKSHEAKQAEQAQFLDFVKLVAGVNAGGSGTIPVGPIRSSIDIDEVLDQGGAGRDVLHLVSDVFSAALDISIKHAGREAPLLRAILHRVHDEVQLASTRLYARIPWDSSDSAVMASFLQVSSENGNAWSDAEVLRHPNLFLAEWLSRLLIETLGRLKAEGCETTGAYVRVELMKAWGVALKSPGVCVKEKAFALIAGTLQETLVDASSASNGTRQLVLESALAELSLDRLRGLAEERLMKEFPQQPIYSRYLQSIVEVVSAGSLAYIAIGGSSESETRYLSGPAGAKQLEEDLLEFDAKEYEEMLESKRKLADEVEKSAEEAVLDNQPRQDADGQTEDQAMQEASTPRNNTQSEVGMEVESDVDEAPDITLSAIANMVAEDSDVVSAAAAIAAAAKGRLSVKSSKEPDEKPPTNDYVFTFPEKKLDFDTSFLDENEKIKLEAGVHGLLGDEPVKWKYGSDLGVLSDTSTCLWSGQLSQYKLGIEDSEPNLPSLVVGSKVIRGPNWKWRDQDGGEGSVGTVEGVSPWSGVEGEGMSVRWPNDSLYTYRWGADGNYDLIHVETDEDGNVVKQYPTPKAKTSNDGTFGSELHVGVLLHLFDDDQPWVNGTKKISGLMEWPDFGAASLIAGLKHQDGSLSVQELQLARGSPDMGWSLRFGCEKWQPGTIYKLYHPMRDDGTPDVNILQGQFAHQAVKQGCVTEVRGEMRLTTRQLFTMDQHCHFSTLSISDEGMTVTCNSGDSRNLALATVGFSSGVHYWEVRVDQAEFGSVFIGVCEKAGPPGSQAALSSRLNRWHGWGFVNFRATYHNSTERIYGDHFNAGDTIGVRLDMEQGKLSFFMDGMKFGEHIVADLGVAFENMKGERNTKVLYPCIGMRKSGDRVALNGKWLSLPGVSSKQLLHDAIDVSTSLHSWYLSLQSGEPSPVTLSQQFLVESWDEWKRWKSGKWQRYPARPRGVLVDFDTSPASCMAVSVAAGLGAPFLAGDRVRVCSQCGRELNQPEEAVILGVYRGHLWFRTETQGNEGGDEGRSWAWYFTPSELGELLLVRRNGKDMTLLENSAAEVSDAISAKLDFAPRSELELKAVDDFAAFVELATRSHTPASDMQLVERLNAHCAAIGVDITNLRMFDVQVPDEMVGSGAGESHAKRSRTHSIIPDDYFSTPALKSISGPALRARCAVLRVLNSKVSRTLPLVALQTSDPPRDTIEVSGMRGSSSRLPGLEYLSTSMKLRSLRRLIFTSTKRSYWDAVLRATTTSTPLPSDEYEDPREIRVIRINRIQAQPAKLSLLAQPSDRLRRSVFGQLYREMRTWSDSSYRRAYCGKGHGGQRRAFKVKFLGEGVNDYGGPYRAVFEQIVDELQMDNVELSKGEQGLLPLLVPCPNRRSGTGSNQDKFLLNPSCGATMTSSGPMALDLHRFLGKIVGTAVRHGLQMGLDLPGLVWRPLAGLDVGRGHLESVDVVAANALSRVEECDEMGASDVLEHLSFTTTLSDGSEVPLRLGGENEPVTLQNRSEYVELVERTRLTESAQQLAALREGLAAVLPMELAPLFTPRELEVLICGRREVDVDLLRQCTEYGEGVDESMPHVQAFWDVLKEMSSEERTSFLRFVWARSRMPNSAKDFPMNFKIQTAHDSGAQVEPDKYLPHAQTCFFALRLPSYSSKEVLREKLLYAIQNSPNMDADVRLHNAEGWADA